MDLVKIGAYIASKRRALGITQAELAGRLGMSDKSVSKWERGICLPDVSIYIELCDILGISINEFIAGEDISSENALWQAEKNILDVAKENKQKYTRLQRIFLCLTGLYFFLICAVAFYNLIPDIQSISPLEAGSAEQVIAETAGYGEEEIIYLYEPDYDFEALGIYLTEYRKGKAVDKRNLMSYNYDKHIGKGVMVLVPDLENFRINLTIADKYKKLSESFVVMECAEEKASYDFSMSRLTEEKEIGRYKETPVACFIFNQDGICSVPLENIEQSSDIAGIDYMYLVSVKYIN